jgi:hypothetical protein
MPQQNGLILNPKFARVAVAALCILTPAAFAGGPITYTFVNVADSTGPLSTSISNAVINDSGTVAFLAGLDAGGIGIHRSSSSSGFTTIALAGPGHPFSQLGAPSINDSDVVAFRGDDSNGDRILIHSAGTIIPITNGWPYTNVGERPSINDDGTVAFRSSYFASYTGIYTGNGGEVSMNYETSQGVFSSFGDPVINDDGVIGFIAGQFGGPVGVFSGTGAGYATIADTNGEFNGFGTTPDINADGAVLFDGQRDAGGAGLYIGSSKGYAPAVTTDDGFSIALGNVGRSINDAGAIAFIAPITATGQFGIFTGPDVVQDNIIKTGETLFGSTVVSLQCGRDALNNDGDVVFSYSLANGIAGVAIAKAPASALPGDITGNGAVDVDDLLAVINAWGNCPSPCPPHCSADIAPAGGNCIVNVDDLLMVINNWG